MYQVVIIEDNPMVAAIDQTYVEQNRELTVAAVFSDAESALDYFLTHTADLVILDYYLPGMDGQGFMSRFRAAGHTADVIMVTAASDAENVTKLSAFGLLDYLVKPFQYPRFQMAVERFLERRSLLCGSGAQAQSTLDRVFLSQQGSEFLPVQKGDPAGNAGSDPGLSPPAAGQAAQHRGDLGERGAFPGHRPALHEPSSGAA